MATRTIFSDENNNEMDCYLNAQDKVYIGIGRADENITHSRFITLDRKDVAELIKILTKFENDMGK